MSVIVNGDGSTPKPFLGPRDSLEYLEDIHKSLVESFLNIIRETPNIRLVKLPREDIDNPYRKSVNFTLQYKNEVRSTPKIAFNLQRIPTPSLIIFMSDLFFYNREPVHFPLNKDFCRFDPLTSFREWFKIISRDERGGMDEFDRYIHEREQEVKILASRVIMGVSPRESRRL